MTHANSQLRQSLEAIGVWVDVHFGENQFLPAIFLETAFLLQATGVFCFISRDISEKS